MTIDKIIKPNNYYAPIQYSVKKFSHMSPKTIEALEEYFLLGNSFNICKKLRENSPLTSAERKIIEEMDFLFDLSAKTAEDDFTVYRGVSCLPQELLNSDETGFVDEGFVSVSTNKNIANVYQANGTLLEIEIPKGQKYIDYADFKKFDKRFQQNGSRELLLPRNSAFELVSLDEENNTMHLRYMGQKTPLPRPRIEIEHTSYPGNYYLKFKNKI